MNNIYFMVREETEQFLIEENGKFSIFLSKNEEEFDPYDGDDQIVEDLLGFELMEGIYSLSQLNSANTIESIESILAEHGFKKVYKFKGVEK